MSSRTQNLPLDISSTEQKMISLLLCKDSRFYIHWVSSFATLHPCCSTLMNNVCILQTFAYSSSRECISPLFLIKYLPRCRSTTFYASSLFPRRHFHTQHPESWKSTGAGASWQGPALFWGLQAHNKANLKISAFENLSCAMFLGGPFQPWQAYDSSSGPTRATLVDI